MQSPTKTVIELETRFWQSMINQDTDAALELLSEPALIVSAHGSMKFDHAAYRKMVEEGAMVLTSFELTNMEAVFPNDTTAILSYRVKQGVAPRGEEDTGANQEMNDTSTWVKLGEEWKCAMHTETPVEPWQPKQ
jgi:ketosteroid isomerase-like protein